MKILLTGGAGFIGSHIVDYLCKGEQTILVVDSLIDGHLSNIQPHIDSGACKFIQGDIRDKSFMLEKLSGVDMVYHFAADPDVRTSIPNPISSYDHNMNGTINVLEYMRKYEIRALVFASSGGTVYGEVDSYPIGENTPFRPISPYGASKAAAEMYLSAYASSYSMKIASVRFANIFGERSRHGVGWDFYHHLRENPLELTILGDGTQQKSYLHVSDAIKAIDLVANNLLNGNQTNPYEYYNVGSESWYSVDEIANIFEKEMGLENVSHKYTGGSKGWVGDVAKMLLSIKKIEQLGYKPQLSFPEGVHRYVTWMEQIKT
ncbi:MAG: NAD-dependent epimerase/dehydratase family protein [Promethearchaeota archaeon]